MSECKIACSGITWRGETPLETTMAEIARTGYAGWIVVETDVTQRPSAMESARISREYLKSIGY